MMQRVTRFPNRIYHFVWRNWDIVAAKRLAKFLTVSVPTVRRLATDLGLKAQPAYLTALRSRLRSLVIRRNWHLLPMGQIEELLGMRGSDLDKFMREDDFLNHKLPPKPRCGPLRYRAPAAAQRRAARHIGTRLASIPEPARTESSFAFLDPLRKGRPDVSLTRVPANRGWALTPRIMHPFDMPHNLTAFDPENTPVEYLQLMRDFGADALWLPVVVFDLVRLPGYPEFGAQRDRIIPKLRALIRRANRADVKIYLYICEPRAQSAAFFQRHPEIRGIHVHRTEPIYHICTSTRQGQDLVRDSIRELCRSLPGVAGLIDICASEYPTHCWSHGHGAKCPRCGKRRAADVVAELLQVMQEGIEASGRRVELIAWNWGWHWVLKKQARSPGDITQRRLCRDACDYIFQRLPEKVKPLLNFEYGTRVRRGGTGNRVWEYSISQAKQGPFTAVQKQAIDRLGRDALARIHISNSTEFLGAPYIPVLRLVAEKISDVRAKGYKGFMGSWIFGGYPSPNLLTAGELSRSTRPNPDRTLRMVAGLYYGKKNAGAVVRAWEMFSRAFRHYPFSIPFQYSSPLHIAPAAEWPLKPTGQQSLMYCHSDDPEHYCRPYDPDTVQRTFREIAAGWEKGLAILRHALDSTDVAHRRIAERDYGVAETFGLCCRSLLNHVRFCSLRKRCVRSRSARDELRALIADELSLAERYYGIMRTDSRIGFEASMQYFILPNDAREKIVGLGQILRKLDRLDRSSRR